MYRDPRIVGFTTNPTLIRCRRGRHENFARKVLRRSRIVPSHSKYSPTTSEMAPGARHCRLGPKRQREDPVVNTKGEFTGPILSALFSEGVTLNVTAIMTVEQVREAPRRSRPKRRRLFRSLPGESPIPALTCSSYEGLPRGACVAPASGAALGEPARVAKRFSRRRRAAISSPPRPAFFPS
jgi:hypothetical protein